MHWNEVEKVERVLVVTLSDMNVVRASPPMSPLIPRRDSDEPAERASA